ncbi:hypothetical protein MUK42_16951, partial [Musa troglodytarum]
HTPFVSRAYYEAVGVRGRRVREYKCAKTVLYVRFAADQRRFRKTSGRHPALGGSRQRRSSRTADDVKGDVSRDAGSAPSDVYIRDSSPK